MEIQKFEYLKNEKGLLDEIKNIFHSFWRLSFGEKQKFDKKNTQVLNELWFKRCIKNTDGTDLVNHGMVKNTKSLNWISENITFLWNKKFLTYASNDTFWEVTIL